MVWRLKAPPRSSGRRPGLFAERGVVVLDDTGKHADPLEKRVERSVLAEGPQRVAVVVDGCGLSSRGGWGEDFYELLEGQGAGALTTEVLDEATVATALSTVCSISLMVHILIAVGGILSALGVGTAVAAGGGLAASAPSMSSRMGCGLASGAPSQASISASILASSLAALVMRGAAAAFSATVPKMEFHQKRASYSRRCSRTASTKRMHFAALFTWCKALEDMGGRPPVRAAIASQGSSLTRECRQWGQVKLRGTKRVRGDEVY
jgi:hypothetical protein